MKNIFSLLPVCTTLIMVLVCVIVTYGQPKKPEWLESSKQKMQQELVSKFGEAQKLKIQIGIKQVADFWTANDGKQPEFEEFIRTNYAGDPKVHDEMFKRIERLLEKLDGHMGEISREFRQQSDLDLGPILPFDELFAAYSPSAHINDDFFSNKIAFVILLNFPIRTLDEKTNDGINWTKRQWAEARLAERYSKRLPADVLLAVSKSVAESDAYIADYNVFMFNVINNKGERLFPKGLRLLSHWNLRDELKANYSDPIKNIEKQRMIQKIMERIVDQTIPQVVINNPNYDWNPYTNEVTRSSEINQAYPSEKTDNLNAPEPNTRYKILRDGFLANKLIDPYSPTAPTHIDRRFNEDRELSEARVKKIFEDVCGSPLVKEIAGLIEKRLGRKLEPFDIWYNGFVPRGKYTEAELDEIVKKKYPSPEAYKNDMPNLFIKLGFSKERADYLAKYIMVDPARGSGHALGASMQGVPAHLRTRVGKDGMDYKGFNIAVHEMGHNVEQTFSLNDVGNTSLQGVPNTAFTEAIAFVFQAQDLMLLGLSAPDEKSEAYKTINDFWMTYEIAGVALVDMGIWRWMYDNPNCSPEEVKEAIIKIAKEIWNKYYAPVLGKKDETMMAVYSHIVHSYLYLPDYPLGHLIAFQIEEQIKKAGAIGPEVERVTTQGRLLPDVWMQHAAGMPVGAEALLEATAKALNKIV